MKKAWSIIWYKEIDSTNLEAERCLESLDNLSVLAAICQTAGKGQGDHKWHSEGGENLTFTIVLKYSPERSLAAASQACVSQALALSIKDFLRLRHNVKADIKLPNDIWVNDKKICGLLISHKVRGGKLLASILGVGLNVNQKTFPSNLPNPTSLALEKQALEGHTVENFDLDSELSGLLGFFEEKLDMMFSEQGRSDLASRFTSEATEKPEHLR